jgi:hypothetical protein
LAVTFLVYLPADPRGQETNALHAQLLPPAKQLARVNPSGSRYLGRNSARFDRRRFSSAGQRRRR